MPPSTHCLVVVQGSYDLVYAQLPTKLFKLLWHKGHACIWFFFFFLVAQILWTQFWLLWLGNLLIVHQPSSWLGTSCSKSTMHNNVSLSRENISSSTFSHSLFGSSWGIVFPVVMYATSLGRLHTALLYSLYLCSCLTSITNWHASSLVFSIPMWLLCSYRIFCN